MTRQSFSDYKHKWWALLGISVLAFTAFLDVTIVNTALPFIQEDLKANIIQLQWVANIFPIILSMTMIAIGKVADRLGKKRVFYFGVIIFGVAALGAGYSKSMGWLTIFRGMQALGASTVFIASSALLPSVFPEEERVKAISIYGGITGFGLLLGPFLGGVLIAALSWRWVFWVNLPIIAIGFTLSSFSLKGSHPEKHSTPMDWMGLFLLITGLGAFMYGVIAGAQSQWSSLPGWISIGVGVCGLITLVILDELKAQPLLDLHIFKEKLVILSALSCALAGVASTVFMFFDPLYLHTVQKLPAFHIGLLIAVIPAAQAMISFVLDRSVKLFGVENILFFSVLAAFVAIVLHRTIGLHTSILFLIAPFFLLGINWGLSNSTMITALTQVIPAHNIGAAIGTIATIWNMVGATLLALSTAVFQSVHAKHHDFLTSFHAATNLNIAFAAIILSAALYTRFKLKKT